MMFYYLDNKKTVACDCVKWSEEYKDYKSRRVDWTEIDGIEISTVFLGIDHNYSGDRPKLFETMVFDDKGNDIYMMRYTTWDEAEEGHEIAKQWVFKYMENGDKGD